MHLENSTVLKSLTESLKPFLQKYKVIEDIVIFGSLAKKKSLPKDVDIALFVREKKEAAIEKIEEEIRTILPKLKIDFLSIDISDIFSPIFLSVTKEGFSVSKEEFISVLQGIKPVKLYKYAMLMLNPVQKVQFDRGLRKIVQEVDGIRVARSVVLIPLQNSELFEEFLKTWKIVFETKRYELIPEYKKRETFGL